MEDNTFYMLLYCGLGLFMVVMAVFIVLANIVFFHWWYGKLRQWGIIKPKRRYAYVESSSYIEPYPVIEPPDRQDHHSQLASGNNVSNPDELFSFFRKH